LKPSLLRGLTRKEAIRQTPARAFCRPDYFDIVRST
jgi:hypothetical protein